MHRHTLSIRRRASALAARPKRARDRRRGWLPVAEAKRARGVLHSARRRGSLQSRLRLLVGVRKQACGRRWIRSEKKTASLIQSGRELCWRAKAAVSARPLWLLARRTDPASRLFAHCANGRMFRGHHTAAHPSGLRALWSNPASGPPTGVRQRCLPIPPRRVRPARGSERP